MNKPQRYTPILKTTSAELKGLRALADDAKDSITPIFELTRSRKTKAHTEGDIHQQLQHVASAYPNRPFVLDLTGHPKHRNSQIRKLQTSKNGYEAWVKFLRKKKLEFPDLVPTVQINDEDVDTPEEFYDRLRQQMKKLSNEFEAMAYRLPVGYENIVEDMEQIKSECALNRLIAVVDAGFIPKNKADVYVDSAMNAIKSLIAQGVKVIAVAGSSFPQSPTQCGEEKEGEFNLEEIPFFKKVQKETKQQLVYGDYATIHPEPNLQAGGRGWVARIDLPCKTLILYRRSRKKDAEKTYTNSYIRVGRKIAGLSEFSTVSNLTGACWGIKQIQMAADGHPPALSPSHWISARFNIHINVRIATM